MHFSPEYSPPVYKQFAIFNQTTGEGSNAGYSQIKWETLQCLYCTLYTLYFLNSTLFTLCAVYTVCCVRCTFCKVCSVQWTGQKPRQQNKEFLPTPNTCHHNRKNLGNWGIKTINNEYVRLFVSQNEPTKKKKKEKIYNSGQN